MIGTVRFKVINQLIFAMRKLKLPCLLLLINATAVKRWSLGAGISNRLISIRV